MAGNAHPVRWGYHELEAATRWFVEIVDNTSATIAARPLMDMTILRRGANFFHVKRYWGGRRK